MKFKINKIYFFITISIAYLTILLSWFYLFYFRNEQVSLSLKNSFYFNPTISISILNFFNRYINFNVILFIKTLIIPFSIYLILVKIYYKYISLIWSSLLALTSLSIYNNLNFRDFIFFSQKITNINYEPLIFDFPIPGFSSLYFIIIFNLIISIKKINNWNLLILSLLISLDFYINPIDSIFLIGIWIIFLLLKLPNGIKIKILSLQVIIVLSIISKGLLSGNINSVTNTINTIPIYNIIAYIVLPLFSIIILYFIQRIDLYEIYNRFSHIYIFMLIEFCIIIISYTKVFSINLDILETRILQFFVHLYYYVPVIYFLAKPKANLNYSFGSESSFIAKRLRFLATIIYNIGENIIALLVSIILILYNIFPLLNTLK